MPSKAPSKAGDFFRHWRLVVLKRFAPVNVVSLAFCYLAVFSAFAVGSQLFGECVLVLALGHFFVTIFRHAVVVGGAVGYVEGYVPEAKESLKKLEVSMTPRRSVSDRRRNIESTVADVSHSLRYLQWSEASLLILTLGFVLLFFMVATFGLFQFAGTATGDGTRLSVLDHIYLNVSTMSTVGFDNSWQAIWPGGSAGYRAFSIVMAGTLFVYTIAFVTLFVSNLVNFRADMVRKELQARYC